MYCVLFFPCSARSRAEALAADREDLLAELQQARAHAQQASESATALQSQLTNAQALSAELDAVHAQLADARAQAASMRGELQDAAGRLGAGTEAQAQLELALFKAQSTATQLKVVRRRLQACHEACMLQMHETMTVGCLGSWQCLPPALTTLFLQGSTCRLILPAEGARCLQ